MIMKDDVVQYLMSMNLGFASRTDLVDPGDGLYFRNYESLYRKVSYGDFWCMRNEEAASPLL
jgi:hypothetical protein